MTTHLDVDEDPKRLSSFLGRASSATIQCTIYYNNPTLPSTTQLKVMFRKPPFVKPQSAMRSSDVRRLKQTLADCGLGDILSGSGAISQCKATLHDGSLAIMYFGSVGRGESEPKVDLNKDTPKMGNSRETSKMRSEPLVVMIDGVGYVPSLYGLACAPQALPRIVTHAPVILRLINGADLMAAGVVTKGMPSVTKGRVVAICVTGSNDPVGVGVMLVDSDTLRGPDVDGKAVRTIHMGGDVLWEMGSKHITYLEGESGEAELTKQPHRGDKRNSEEEHREGKKGETKGCREEDADFELVSPASSSEWEMVNQGSNIDNLDLSLGDMQIITAEMDLLFQSTFLQALLTFDSDNDKMALPVSASAFFSRHMQKLCPTLDIRKSSFKKLGKFLMSMEKRGTIKTKEMKGEVMLLAIHRNHEDFSSDSISHLLSPAVPSSSATPRNSNTAPPQISVTHLYKPMDKFYDFLLSFKRLLPDPIGFSRESILSRSELQTILDTYVQTENLSTPKNRRTITLDPTLRDLLKTKTDAASLETLQRDEVLTRACSKCTPLYKLHLPTNPPEDKLIRGLFKPIIITIERRGGNKTITKVSAFHFLTPCIPLQPLIDTLKTKCASAVALSADSQRNPELMLQGDQVNEICKVLESYGVPLVKVGKLWKSEFVEVVYKSGTAPRKS